MGCQGLLLFGKWHWWRRRWPLRDHLPIDHGCRRRGHVIRRRSFRSQHTLPCGNHGDPGAYRRPGKLLWGYGNRRTGDRLRAGKSTLRNHRHRTPNIPVHVVHVGDGRASIIDDRGVVNIGDGGGVDRGVADIHLVHIAAAHTVRWHVNFTRTQREPSHVAADADANAASTDEDHQSGCIHRPHIHRSGYPAPPAADDHPASIVVGRIAPWGVIDPRVSPGRNPVPVALAIRRPAWAYIVWVPDMTIVPIIAPASIVIQVFVADDIAGHIFRRARIVVAMIAAGGPVVELVGATEVFYVGVERIGSAAEGGSFSGVQGVGLAVAGGLASAVAQADDGIAAVFTSVQPVVSGLGNRECQVRCIDLEVIARIEATHTKVDRTRRKFDLRGMVIQVQEGDAGVLAQANHGRSELHFGARALVGPEPVAGRHGAIGNGLDPIVLAGWLEGNRTLHVTESSDTSGGIILLTLVLSGSSHGEDCGRER